MQRLYCTDDNFPTFLVDATHQLFWKQKASAVVMCMHFTTASLLPFSESSFG
jgi:hypothetical protein